MTWRTVLIALAVLAAIDVLSQSSHRLVTRRKSPPAATVAAGGASVPAGYYLAHNAYGQTALLPDGGVHLTKPLPFHGFHLKPTQPTSGHNAPISNGVDTPGDDSSYASDSSYGGDAAGFGGMYGGLDINGAPGGW